MTDAKGGFTLCPTVLRLPLFLFFLSSLLRASLFKLNRRHAAAAWSRPSACLSFPVCIYVRVRGKLFHPAAPAYTSTDGYTLNLSLSVFEAEYLGVNLSVESCSSKTDVYEMKDEGRNDWADKSPTEADFVVKQKSQERFSVDICSYFNNALSLTADYPAAIGGSLRWYRAGVNVNNMIIFGHVCWLNDVF